MLVELARRLRAATARALRGEELEGATSKLAKQRSHEPSNEGRLIGGPDLGEANTNGNGAPLANSGVETAIEANVPMIGFGG